MRVGLLRVLDSWNEEEEYRTLVDVLLPTMDMQVDASVRDAAEGDAKILGSLLATLTIFGLLLGAHDSLSSFWWLPAVALGAGSVAFIIALYPRNYSAGPQGAAFYEFEQGRRKTALAAARDMKDELVAAWENNRKPSKMRLYKIGFWCWMAGLAGCPPVVLLHGS
jgi:hypothetical protein